MWTLRVGVAKYKEANEVAWTNDRAGMVKVGFRTQPSLGGCRHNSELCWLDRGESLALGLYLRFDSGEDH